MCSAELSHCRGMLHSQARASLPNKQPRTMPMIFRALSSSFPAASQCQARSPAIPLRRHSPLVHNDRQLAHMPSTWKLWARCTTRSAAADWAFGEPSAHPGLSAGITRRTQARHRGMCKAVIQSPPHQAQRAGARQSLLQQPCREGIMQPRLHQSHWCRSPLQARPGRCSTCQCNVHHALRRPVPFPASSRSWPIPRAQLGPCRPIVQAPSSSRLALDLTDQMRKLSTM
jgi:hypothetical protein